MDVIFRWATTKSASDECTDGLSLGKPISSIGLFCAGVLLHESTLRTVYRNAALLLAKAFCVLNLLLKSNPAFLGRKNVVFKRYHMLIRKSVL